jgi:Protein of unknown function (DUF2946)
LRQHRCRLAWVAFVALFALAMVPTLSRLLAHAGGGSTWAEICTPQGLKTLGQSLAQTSDSPAPASAGLHLDHCPLCGLAGHAMAPPAAAEAPFAKPLGQPEPPLFLRAPRPLFAWAAAQPRAPPVRG